MAVGGGAGQGGGRRLPAPNRGARSRARRGPCEAGVLPTQRWSRSVAGSKAIVWRVRRPRWTRSSCRRRSSTVTFSRRARTPSRGAERSQERAMLAGFSGRGGGGGEGVGEGETPAGGRG